MRRMRWRTHARCNAPSLYKISKLHPSVGINREVFIKYQPIILRVSLGFYWSKFLVNLRQISQSLSQKLEYSWVKSDKIVLLNLLKTLIVILTSMSSKQTKMKSSKNFWSWLKKLWIIFFYMVSQAYVRLFLTILEMLTSHLSHN